MVVGSSPINGTFFLVEIYLFKKDISMKKSRTLILKELRTFIRKIIKEEVNSLKAKNHNSELIQIDKKKAEALFNKGIFVYLKTNNYPPESTENLFMINDKIWDKGMNLYSQGMTPKEYGFENIVNWVEGKIKKPLKYYTLNSKEPIAFFQ